MKYKIKKIEKLPVQQQQLRMRISSVSDSDKYHELKTQRNQILHRIQQIQKETKEAEIGEKAKELDRLDNTSKVFKALNYLNQKPFSNTAIHDNDGKITTNPNEMYKIMHDHYDDHQAEEIEAFVGEPRPLTEPITIEEYNKTLTKLTTKEQQDLI